MATVVTMRSCTRIERHCFDYYICALLYLGHTRYLIGHKHVGHHLPLDPGWLLKEMRQDIDNYIQAVPMLLICYPWDRYVIVISNKNIPFDPKRSIQGTPGVIVSPSKKENQEFAQDSRFVLYKTRSTFCSSPRLALVKKAVAVSPTRIPPVLRINRRNPSTSLTNVDRNCCMFYLPFLISPQHCIDACDRRTISLVHRNAITSNHISTGHAYGNIRYSNWHPEKVDCFPLPFFQRFRKPHGLHRTVLTFLWCKYSRLSGQTSSTLKHIFWTLLRMSVEHGCR